MPITITDIIMLIEIMMTVISASSGRSQNLFLAACFAFKERLQETSLETRGPRPRHTNLFIIVLALSCSFVLF